MPNLPIYMNVGRPDTNYDTDYDTRIEADNSSFRSRTESYRSESDYRSDDSDPFP